jgi:predicted lipid-binding transport protein (Tim44 family)
MRLKKWIKGLLILFTLMFLCTWAFQLEAWARAGGGRSMGSRGSRSMSGARTSTSPRLAKPSATDNPTRPSASPPGASTAASGGFWQSFGGGLLGGLVGGMLFRSLFGGTAGGGGGFGLLDILLLAGIAYLIYWYIKRKRQAAEATAGYYQSRGTVELPPQPRYQPVYHQPQIVASERDQDLQGGLANIRQFDPDFDEAQFQDRCMDAFFDIQGAWTNRDMRSVRKLLTEEMYRIFQEDADQFKAQKKINRLENIAVRSVDITEAWQESGSDFITVRVYANLLDYNVDEITGQVVEGSKTEPVKFEEYWTFTRPVGDNPWQLSAIQQAA